MANILLILRQHIYDTQRSIHNKLIALSKMADQITIAHTRQKCIAEDAHNAPHAQYRMPKRVHLWLCQNS